jgi:hypothetical protein
MIIPGYYRLAGATVRIDWPDAELRAVLGGALAHRAGVESAADLSITVRAGRPDWPAVTGAGLSFSEDANGLSVVDAVRRLAVHVTAAGERGEVEFADARHLPLDEQGAPFRLIFQRWLATRRAQVLHAGAVGLAGRGAVLLAARGGGGKSNTVLACLGSPLHLLGEDFLAVDEAEHPRVWSLYNTAKIYPADLARFPALATETAVPGMAGGKTLLVLGARHAAQFADGLPLRAILVLKITGQRASRLVPAGPMEAIREMLASPLMVVPSARRSAFEFIVRLAGRLPVHRLELGTDLRQPPEIIRDFLEGGAR